MKIKGGQTHSDTDRMNKLKPQTKNLLQGAKNVLSDLEHLFFHFQSSTSE